MNKLGIKKLKRKRKINARLKHHGSKRACSKAHPVRKVVITNQPKPVWKDSKRGWVRTLLRNIIAFFRRGR